MLKKSGGNSETSSAARTVIFICVAVMAVLLIVSGIYIFRLKSEKKSEQSSPNNAEKGFSELIAEKEQNTDKTESSDEFPLTAFTLEEAFALYSVSDTYYQECTVASTGADGTKHERIKRVLRDGDKYNITTYNKNTLIETIKCDGENILIINETTGARNKISVSQGVTPMELASMPSHEYLLALLEEYRSDSEGSVISSADYELTRTRDMNILEVTIGYRDSSVKESYVYYLNYGIIYSCETAAENGAKPYSMTTTFVSRSTGDFVTEDSFLIN